MPVTSLQKLIDLGSNTLCDQNPVLSGESLRFAGGLGHEYFALLNSKNGFFAFESALQLFPSVTTEKSIGIDQWNRSDGWRSTYGALAESCLFFAQDIFGCQFCIFEDKVWSFDPETGLKQFIAASLEAWAAALLDDYQVLTGYSIAHLWQQQNGRLPVLNRLVPKIPFICNGAFDLSNLACMDAEASMKARAEFAVQIKNLPDGSQINFKVDT